VQPPIGSGCPTSCWGFNNFGQLGDGTTENKRAPTQVGVAASWSAVAANATHTCGVKDGRLYCWGAGGSGQLGVFGVYPVLWNE